MGAAFRASIMYLLLNPISRPFPLPSTGQQSWALPRAVLVVMSISPSPMTHRRGLLSFSLTMSDTRSMQASSCLVLAVTLMGL